MKIPRVRIMYSSDIRSSSAPVLIVLPGLLQMVLWAWSGSQLPLGVHEDYSNACGHLVGGGQEEKIKKQTNIKISPQFY